MKERWLGPRLIGIGVLLGMTVLVGAPLAWAQGSAGSHGRSGSAPSAALTGPQPYSHADLNGHGANPGSPTEPNPYGSTRDGSPPLNGNGAGQATGQPCAGCAGKADNKNPPGQQPGAGDPNAGYECDRNHGIGVSNPAHTGCVVPTTTTSTTVPTAPTTTAPSTTTTVPAVTTTTAPAGARTSPATGTRPPAPPAGPSTAPSGRLAFTGAPIWAALAAASALLIIGGGLTSLAFRRRPTVARSEDGAPPAG